MKRIRLAVSTLAILAGLVTATTPAAAATWRADAVSGPPTQHWYGLGPTRTAAVDNALRVCHARAARPATCHITSVRRVR
jgi:hypothetical protein